MVSDDFWLILELPVRMHQMEKKRTFEEKIILDLQKTGYPTEITTASFLQERDWYVIHKPSFWDNEEQKSREFDIRGYREWKSNSEKLSIGAFLITECKKSEKPWVFFATPEGYLPNRLGRIVRSNKRGTPLFPTYYQEDALISDDELRSFHHYFHIPIYARTFYEPFKNQENADHSSMIYSAVMSVVKATLYTWSDTPIENWIRIYYPLIVFSGNMFDARVNSDKTIELIKADHIRLSFHYIQQQTHRSHLEMNEEFIIDIINESYLGIYLRMIEEEQYRIASML